MRKAIITFCAACAALVSSAFIPLPVYTDSWTEDGITYSQLGGVKNSNAVVTAVNTTIIGSVRSVNGKVGHVTLNAGDVGALPDTFSEEDPTFAQWVTNSVVAYIKAGYGSTAGMNSATYGQQAKGGRVAVTIGTRATTENGGHGGVAIGYGATVTHTDAIAIGDEAESHGAETFNLPSFVTPEKFYLGSQTLANLFVRPTRKVNGKPLSSDITISSSDVGAYSTAQTDNLLSGKRGISDFVIKDTTQGWCIAEIEDLIPLQEGQYITVQAYRGIDDYGFVSVFVHNPDGGKYPASTSPRFQTVALAQACTDFIIDSGTGVGKRVWKGDRIATVRKTVPVTRKVNGQPLTSDITIEGMTDNAAVLTNGTLQTKSGDAIGADAIGAVPTSRKINGQELTDDITIQTMPDNGLVLSQDGKIRTSNQQTQIIPSHIGAASANAVEETQAIVQTWEGFLDGSNVVFSITNYISGAYQLGAAKLRILEMRGTNYVEVYNSRDEVILHLNDFSNHYVRVALDAVVQAVADQLSSKADKAWGNHTSAGGVAPSNTVYMTAPNTVFAGGMEYERLAVGEGSICVLTTKGAPVYTQGDEGTFKFHADGGTNYFGFAKTDSYTIGCNTDGITVQRQIVTLQYDLTGATPCIWYKGSLADSTPWEQLNLPDGSPVSGASHLVQWRPDDGSGTRYCDINCQEGAGFFKATVEMSGSAKFITNMPADFSAGILCTDGIHKVAVDWNNGNPRLVEAQ